MIEGCIVSRIAKIFAKLDKCKALIPYITVGDPSLDITLELMHSMVANGADILELGVPFSDPMADGPIIQRAVKRALNNQVSLSDVLAIVHRFRETNQHTPVVLMGYLNPIHKMGYAQFAQSAANAGVDGVLTVDSPIETIEPLQAQLKQHEIDCIFLIAPTTTLDRVKEIAQYASGFVYYVSLKGVTGSAQLDTKAVANKLATLRQYIHIPIGVGFGINDAKSAAQIGAVADAVIVGSRIVREIEEQGDHAVVRVGQLVANLKAVI